MHEKEKFILEERPESEVYTTPSGFIAIAQKIRNEETVVLFTAEEAEKVIGFLKQCIEKIRAKDK